MVRGGQEMVGGPSDLYTTAPFSQSVCLSDCVYVCLSIVRLTIVCLSALHFVHTVFSQRVLDDGNWLAFQTLQIVFCY